jgi:hypothetical protein
MADTPVQAIQALSNEASAIFDSLPVEKKPDLGFDPLVRAEEKLVQQGTDGRIDTQTLLLLSIARSLRTIEHEAKRLQEQRFVAYTKTLEEFDREGRYRQ